MAIARGEAEGLAEAYERHGGSVLSMALRLCGTDLAETATRAAFMCLWHTPVVFDPSRGSLRTCLVTHAQARAVVLLRDTNARRTSEAATEHMADTVVSREPFLLVLRDAARAAMDNRRVQASSGSVRANSSTRPRPVSGHPQTR